jgi:hypothetical protein
MHPLLLLLLPPLAAPGACTQATHIERARVTDNVLQQSSGTTQVDMCNTQSLCTALSDSNTLASILVASHPWLKPSTPLGHVNCLAHIRQQAVSLSPPAAVGRGADGDVAMASLVIKCLSYDDDPQLLPSASALVHLHTQLQGMLPCNAGIAALTSFSNKTVMITSDGCSHSLMHPPT